MEDTSGLDIPNVSQLGGGDVIDQIPIGAQVFPWQDMKPTALPSRGPAYPDDVLPTTALVVGNNADQAQRVDTDGNHALKVYVVNESGGGGGGGAGNPTKYGGIAFDTTLIDQQTFFEDIGLLDVPAQYIYEWNWSVAITRAITSTDKTAEIASYLRVPGGSTFVRIFHAIFSTFANNFVQNGSVSLVNPIDIAATFGGAVPHVFISGGSTFFSANVSINGI